MQKVGWVKGVKGQKGLDKGRTIANIDNSEITALLHILWIRIMTFTQLFGSQLTFTGSKSTIETLEKGAKYVQSQQ